MFRNKRRIFFPLFWFEARTRVSPQLSEEFKLLPRVLLSLQVFGVISIIIGVIMLVWYPIKLHLQNRLIHQIKINNLDTQTHHIVGKTISMQPEDSPLLVTSVQANAKILERADTQLSDFSIEASTSTTDRSSMQSTTSSTWLAFNCSWFLSSYMLVYKAIYFIKLNLILLSYIYVGFVQV